MTTQNEKSNIDLTDYIEDAKGRFVHRDTVKPIDLARDELVTELIAKAKAASRILHDLKYSALADIEAFCELSAEKYGIIPRGKKGKGNITLTTFDGRRRLIRAMQDQLTFDERLQAAKQLIDECLAEWGADSRKEIRTLINDAFQVDKEGEVSTARVLSLRRHNFDHPKWKAAMEAISDALRVASSKTYIRVYERNEKTGNYEQIPLDLSSV